MNLDTKYWYLRDHKLFSVLSSSELRSICMISNFKTARKGEIILFSHDENTRVYFLKKGTLKIVETDENGNEIVKDVIQKGDIFGEFTLTETQSDEYAVAVSDNVICCSFRMDDFEQLLEKNPQLGLSYTKWMGFRFKRLQSRYANLMFKDVRTRFMIFLKDWATKEGTPADTDIILKNYLTHQDIASLICSTRQTVTQLFNEYKEKGILDYNRTEIILKKDA
ncbi:MULTISPECIES: Crp/Fnr family transcriptional regulator [Emticicia]|uniref:Crp/Fnr family transcriptional regulator n=1 Tax=Emticicia TaxID=312278 RepID=UPI00209F6FF0|nr:MULTISPECIES: Crp/Fnr family transcriptional regulator [Emticicia]UTA66886.1 Crp/Fnr family transcriptional regulator [Emticicia sp. 21SJ11W-3]